jgi:hypothetical protein
MVEPSRARTRAPALRAQLWQLPARAAKATAVTGVNPVTSIGLPSLSSFPSCSP